MPVVIFFLFLTLKKGVGEHGKKRAILVYPCQLSQESMCADATVADKKGHKEQRAGQHSPRLPGWWIQCRLSKFREGVTFVFRQIHSLFRFSDAGHTNGCTKCLSRVQNKTVTFNHHHHSVSYLLYHLLCIHTKW